MMKLIVMCDDDFKEKLEAVHEKTISKLGIELRGSLFVLTFTFLERDFHFKIQERRMGIRDQWRRWVKSFRIRCEQVLNGLTEYLLRV